MLEAVDAIIDSARKFQNLHARLKDTPVQFIVRAVYDEGQYKDIPVENERIDHLPPWYWPVLDQDKSTAALNVAVKKLSNPKPETLTLIAAPSDMPKLVIGDLSDTVPLPPPENRKMDIIFLNHDSPIVDDIVAKITISESNHTESARVVIVCAPSSEPDIDLRIPIEHQIDIDDESLEPHQQYAMDGTGSILWLGTVIPGYPSPSRDDVIAAIKSEQLRTGAVSDIHILSGDVFDSGNGLAYIKSAHRIFTIAAP